MKAIFLLAGMSSRFLGLIKHKALVEIVGQTLLERQIIQAHNLGVQDFVFGTGAAEGLIHQEVVRIMHQLEYRTMAFIYNNDYATTGNWTTLWNCINLTKDDGDCLVFEGDVVINNIPFENVGDGKSRWLVVDNYLGDGCFVRVENGIIISKDIVRNKVLPTTEYVKKSAGIFYLNFKDTKMIPDCTPRQFNYIDDYMEKRGMSVEITDYNNWGEIDNMEDFVRAQKTIIKKVVKK